MMKKKLILSFFFVALGFGVVKAQDLPDKKETLKTVTKVNDYFMKKYADYRTPSFISSSKPLKLTLATFEMLNPF